MTALSIREMNIALVAKEYAMDDYLNSLPKDPEPKYYWQIYRKSRSKAARKGARQWVFVRDFIGTKSDMAEFWNKWFRDGQHRLKCVFEYGAKGVSVRRFS